MNKLKKYSKYVYGIKYHIANTQYEKTSIIAEYRREYEPGADEYLIRYAMSQISGHVPYDVLHNARIRQKPPKETLDKILSWFCDTYKTDVIKLGVSLKMGCSYGKHHNPVLYYIKYQYRQEAYHEFHTRNHAVV